MVNAQFAERDIDSLLQTYYSPGNPGAAIGIMYRGKILFNKSYGIADLKSKKKITSTTNFNIGSITKQFTAMAILQLLQKKKITLEDTLSGFFPDFNRNVGNRITVKELLSHNSGIVDHYDFVDSKSLQHAIDRDVLNAVKSLDSVYFSPGTRYRYSNTAYCLLALIIEKVAGTSYARYLRENIFEPAGMKHAIVWQENKTIENKATGYEFDNTSKTFRRSDADENVFFSTQGDGGIYTSIDEYLKWFGSLQNGKAFSDTLVRMARSVQFPVGENLGYGFGWFVENTDQNRAVYHTGSNGGFRSIVYSIPEKDYVLVIFSNRTGIDFEELAKKINGILKISSRSVTKIEPYVSFQHCWPIFAPCKKIPLYLTSFIKNWSASGTALN